MTIASETNKSGPYNCNGVTTVFGYGFRILDEAHIRVILTDATTSVETVLLLGTNYTVAGVGAATGSIATVTAYPAGKKITLIRNAPFTQGTDLENQGAYYAETVEAALDLAVQRDQQLKELVDRSVKIPASADSSGLDSLIANIVRLGASADNIDAAAGALTEIAAAPAAAATATAQATIATTQAGIATTKAAAGVVSAANAATSEANAAVSAGTLAAAISAVTGLGYIYDWGFVFDAAGTTTDYGSVP